MANQIYDYNPAYGGTGLSNVYPSRSATADLYLSDSSLIGSSRYLGTDPLSASDSSKYSLIDRGSSMYFCQIEGLRYTGSDIAGVNGFSANRIYGGTSATGVSTETNLLLSQASWHGVDVTVAFDPVVASVKRSTEGLGVVGIAINVGMKILLCCWRRQTFSLDKLLFWKKKIKDAQNVDAFLKNHEFLATKRYKYSEIKKMTNSFKDKLGQGGYGGVFKGKLIDGRMVAVKVLSESKGNGEEFINEVATISRTSHVNVVTLLGFCVEDSKRALVYEFMPNGSLEKFIYNEKSLQSHPHLEWETLYKIAIGIARGLEYLHRGCSTRILHFDIKPHNILLDHEFCPKIADFGLAKSCVKKESIISMIGTRGTSGYIAPELINRNFGGVSHKLDVYSYGMMVLEMVGGRKNIDVGVENISEIYFPHWIHKRLSKCGVDLGLWVVTTIEDEDIARKMILVSLWCIQMDPSTPPAMNRVLEMLEGNLNALQIPHMPFFTSPPRSQAAP